MFIRSGRRFAVIAYAVLTLCLSPILVGQAGSSGSINGTVVDQTGAVVAGATIELRNPVSGFDRLTTTDPSGKFSYANVPFNPYHLTITAEGFAAYAQDVEPRSA